MTTIILALVSSIVPGVIIYKMFFDDFILRHSDYLNELWHYLDNCIKENLEGIDIAIPLERRRWVKMDFGSQKFMTTWLTRVDIAREIRETRRVLIREYVWFILILIALISVMYNVAESSLYEPLQSL